MKLYVCLAVLFSASSADAFSTPLASVKLPATAVPIQRSATVSNRKSVQSITRVRPTKALPIGADLIAEEEPEPEPVSNNYLFAPFIGVAGGMFALMRAASKRKSYQSIDEVSAEESKPSRREAMSLFAAGVASASAKPAFAAYGDSANVFGQTTNDSGFIPYAGNGYAFLLPSKYNPSKERPFPGQDCYFEDNFDAVTNISVIRTKAKGSSIESYGKPEVVLSELGYLLGEQVYSGETRSEGGFAANRVSTAAVLDVYSTEKNGKQYYMYEILTRTADGDEGGRHQLIKATVSDGDLYVMKLQSGDKRWFKGQERDLKKTWESFTVV